VMNHQCLMFQQHCKQNHHLMLTREEGKDNFALENTKKTEAF